MLVLGLTGSIGMGKSTAAAHLRGKGIPVFDADATVHALYEGQAVPLIEAAFPGTTVAGKVDRTLLSQAILNHPDGAAFAFDRINAIVHPLVRQAQFEFLHNSAAAGHDIAVLEIPLLFETGAQARVDAVIVISAGEEIQRARVLARPGMTAEKLDSILLRQMPDAEKRCRADFVVDSSGTIQSTQAQIDRIIESLAGAPRLAMQNWLRNVDVD